MMNVTRNVKELDNMVLQPKWSRKVDSAVIAAEFAGGPQLYDG